jgi:uncharacterized protein YacL
MILLCFRLLFVFLCLVLSSLVRPSTISLTLALAIGAVVAAIAIVCETQLRVLKTRLAAWMAAGALAGILAGAAMSLALQTSLNSGAARALFPPLCILFFMYIGLRCGASMAGQVAAVPAEQTVLTLPSQLGTAKVLDTSTIIDGRIADVAEAGFLDGPIIVAEFILRELQAVADSTDASKRQRGRRGLDMLERMRNCARVKLQVVADDFPGVREVDLKLIELAKKHHARLVTNDFNLNKVAHLHDIPVMNVNDLANTLRPVVLPGERLSIAILKEGKEPNQGVGYLNDGTMVVVDHARRWIGQTVELQVTSVLQTPSGKMIFGRYEEGLARTGESLSALSQVSH